MKNNIKYTLLTCFIAYFIGAIILFIFSISQSGWSRIDSDSGRFVAGLLTLFLSEFQFWGDYWYLSALVPWLGSSILLVLLIIWMKRNIKRKLLLGSYSIGAYYLVMFLVYIIGKLVTWWGNIQPQTWENILFYLMILVIFVGGGFGLGYLAAWITDKIIKIPVKESPLTLERGPYDTIS